MVAHGLQRLDTPEKKKAYAWALHCINMSRRHPESRLWRMREKQALNKLEEFHWEG